MDGVLLADQCVYKKDTYYLISWFGTILSSQARFDWIEHRPLAREKEQNRLLYLDLRSKSTSSSQLLKRHTAPRSLPSFAIIAQAGGEIALRCVKSSDTQDYKDHFLTAIPGGAIEINRTYISSWETFLLLSPLELNAIYNLLYCKRLRLASDGEAHFVFKDGFRLCAGQTTLDLRALYSQKTLENAGAGTKLYDTAGNEIQFA